MVGRFGWKAKREKALPSLSVYLLRVKIKLLAFHE